MKKFRNIDILRDHELLTLLGVVGLLRNFDQSFTIINHAFEEYKKMCKKYSVTPHNKTSFRKYIHQLIQMNLITSKPVRNGRFLEITLLEIPRISLTELLEDILERKTLS